MTWAYLSIPISFAVMMLFSFELLVEDIRRLFSREGKI
jgi:TRAP-type C4-dicarboxylate transport system permease small subunit